MYQRQASRWREWTEGPVDGSAPSPLWEQSAPSPAPSPVLPRVCRRSPRVLILANLPRKAPGGDFCGDRGWPQTPGWPFTGRRGRRWDPRPEPSRSLLKKTRRGSEPGLQGFRGRSAGCSPSASSRKGPWPPGRGDIAVPMFTAACPCGEERARLLCLRNARVHAEPPPWLLRPLRPAPLCKMHVRFAVVGELFCL